MSCAAASFIAVAKCLLLLGLALALGRSEPEESTPREERAEERAEEVPELPSQPGPWGPPPFGWHGAEVFVHGFEGYSVYRIPAIARSGDVLLAFAEARRVGHDYDHIDLMLKRSLDGGKSWSGPKLIAGDPYDLTMTVQGNPVPIVEATSGTVHLVYCVNNTYVFHTRSTDAGSSWSQPTNITSMVKRPGWGWMATGPGHGFAMQSGRLVVPFNTFLAESNVVTSAVQTGCKGVRECDLFRQHGTLITWYNITNMEDSRDVYLTGHFTGTHQMNDFVWAGDRSAVMYSDDHGETWHLGGQISERPGSSEAIVEEIKNGELLMSFRVEDRDTGCRKFARSRDGGESFEPFYEPAGCVPDPVCQESMLAMPGNTDVILTSGPGNSWHRSNLAIFASTDGGQTFKYYTQLNVGSAAYSDLVSLGTSDGVWQVGVTFENGGGIMFISFNITEGSLPGSNIGESSNERRNESMLPPLPRDIISAKAVPGKSLSTSKVRRNLRLHSSSTASKHGIRAGS